MSKSVQINITCKKWKIANSVNNLWFFCINFLVFYIVGPEIPDKRQVFTITGTNNIRGIFLPLLLSVLSTKLQEFNNFFFLTHKWVTNMYSHLSVTVSVSAFL